MLEPQHGSGFSARQLELCRQFYRTFPNSNALRSQFSWTHYRLLVRIDTQDKREFYIAEGVKNSWTAREMERQINNLIIESAYKEVANAMRNSLDEFEQKYVRFRHGEAGRFSLREETSPRTLTN